MNESVCACEGGENLQLRSADLFVRVRLYSLSLVQVAVAQMAATGIVPPYDFISDGMGLKNAGRELW